MNLHNMLADLLTDSFDASALRALEAQLGHPLPRTVALAVALRSPPADRGTPPWHVGEEALSAVPMNEHGPFAWLCEQSSDLNCYLPLVRAFLSDSVYLGTNGRGDMMFADARSDGGVVRASKDDPIEDLTVTAISFDDFVFAHYLVKHDGEPTSVVIAERLRGRICPVALGSYFSQRGFPRIKGAASFLRRIEMTRWLYAALDQHMLGGPDAGLEAWQTIDSDEFAAWLATYSGPSSLLVRLLHAYLLSRDHIYRVIEDASTSSSSLVRDAAKHVRDAHQVGIGPLAEFLRERRALFSRASA